MAAQTTTYPASLSIDYPDKLERLSTFFRLLWAIPILILISILTGSGSEGFMHHSAHNSVMPWGGSIAFGLAAATALTIIFRQRYPRWWFDFALELTRFSARVGAYLFLLSDQYPSTEDKQSVHLDVSYPNAPKDLNRWLPIVKWFLAIPHYIVLAVLLLGAIGATIIAWFAILFTGQYPRGLFDYVVGVGRWALRVNAYAFLLVTDAYPPFSLK
jgi:membrane protein YdbS with pleckstrin-like domain